MEPQECMPLSVGSVLDRLCHVLSLWSKYWRLQFLQWIHSNVCQDWMNNKIADLEKKRDGAGKYGRIF